MIPDPNATPPQAPGQSAQQPGAVTPPVTPKPIDAFVAKKGVKSLDDIPKMYEDTEASLHRTTQKFQTAKTEIEQGTNGQKTLDDNGKVIDNPNYQHSFQPQNQPPYQPGQPQEQVFDPYTGQLITDPIALQLARMPIGQREAFLFNAFQDQREKQQQASYGAEQEVLNAPEAKGFENDVRTIMQALPLQMRADKKNWNDALLRAKGMKFDQMRQSASQEGVENFLNKQGMQPLPEAPGATTGARLTPEQEQSFQWYQANQPGMFKDRTHFLNRYSNKR